MEIGTFYLILQIIIWGGRSAPIIKGTGVFLLILMMVFSAIYHQDSWERLGFGHSHFLPNLRWTLIICAPLLLPLFILAWKNRNNAIWEPTFSFALYPFWALLQEYVLLAYLGNRWDEAIESKKLIPWFNGFLFSMAHYPNPVLMIVTFLAGVIFTGIFLKHRHLVPISLMHAGFGVGISMAWGHINGIMSVGPGYYIRIGTLPY